MRTCLLLFRGWYASFCCCDSFLGVQKHIISDKSITNEEKAEKISKVIPEALDNYLRFYAVRLFKSNSTQEQKLSVLLH